MNRAESYVKQIESINAELKRLNARRRILLQQKREQEQYLYKHMKSNNIEKYKGYTQDKIAPKDKVKRKPRKEQEKDGVKYFEEHGFTDPKRAYDEFTFTRKYMNKDEVVAEKEEGAIYF
jgi:hypothetical protein